MKKGANSEKALNKNALSEALISIDKVIINSSAAAALIIFAALIYIRR